MSKSLAGEMLVGRVDFGESFQARSASNSAIDAMAVSIVRLYQEAEELRATIALLEAERDLLRVQVQAGEQLGLALVKTIDELKTENAAIYALQAGSRRATLEEIAESVRDKYDERYEGEGIDNE